MKNNAHQQLDIFTSRLPYKPYCTDELEYGLRIRSKLQALQKRHIQHNPPSLLSYMVYDIDRADSAYAWEDAYLPPPAWVAINSENGHSHMAYGLIAPVTRTNLARQAPIRFAAAIEYAYCVKLDADRNYSGLITKNPIHKHWNVIFPAGEAANHGYYDLAYLAEYVTLPQKIPKKAELASLGRNVSLFDTVRLWAYSEVRRYWRPNGFNSWYAAVLSKAQHCNTFMTALSYSEVKAIAKSVATWVWRNITPTSFQSFVDHTHTPEIQAERGKKGGKVSGNVRAKKAGNKAEIARRMRDQQGLTNQEIANELDTSTRSVRRWLATKPISDVSPQGVG